MGRDGLRAPGISFKRFLRMLQLMRPKSYTCNDSGSPEGVLKGLRAQAARWIVVRTCGTYELLMRVSKPVGNVRGVVQTMQLTGRGITMVPCS